MSPTTAPRSATSRGTRSRCTCRPTACGCWMPRRDDLLTAAREVIQRNGFASATVGEITRAAGASLGLLNYHFASKDEVVAEAFAAVAREELAELAEISRRHSDPAERPAPHPELRD